MSAPIAFQGEVMLAGWSETHNGGAKVTFWLADEGDLAAFKSMTVAKGKAAGQRLAIVAVEIGDDEQPITRNRVMEGNQELKGGELAKLAGRLCEDPDFLFWADVGNSEAAAQWIRSLCGISSRAMLDHDLRAAAIFHQEIRKPFREWAESQK
ncbi:hypothetical protein ACOTH8_21435 [Achromobacter xylosoxidans]